MPQFYLNHVVVIIFPLSLLKVGDHRATHLFSPTLPVYCYCCTLHQSLANPVCNIVASLSLYPSSAIVL